MTTLRRTASVLAALIALGSARTAHAADPAAAQALFDDAKRLMAEGRYSLACPKLEESERLDPGMGTLFQLGVCYEHVGRDASAWAAFLEVAARAKVAGQSARERVARERAVALEPTLSKLVIVPSAGDVTLGLAIARDGAEVGRPQWGVAVPVDPGQHRIVASAPGFKAWSIAVDVTQGRVVSVAVPPLEADAPPPPPAQAPAYVPSRGFVPPSAPPSAPPDARVENDGSRQRAAGLIVGAIGIAGIATGAVLGFASKRARDDSSSHCAGDVCDAVGVHRRDDARRFGDEATIAIGAGAALAVTGLVVFVASPSRSTSRGTRVAPMIGASGSGIVVRGAF